MNLAELGSQQTNVKGTFLALKAFMPFAEPSHATVLSLVTGMAALPAKNLPSLSSYLASKLAQTKVIEFLSVENPNIFAATIHPGIVETAIFKKSGADSTKLPMDKGQSGFLPTKTPKMVVLLPDKSLTIYLQWSFPHISTFGCPARKLAS